MTTPNTFTDWPSLRSLATVPTSIELLGTTSGNEPVRFLASLLAAQITDGEDGTSVRVAYRRTRSSTRPTQPTGTRDVSTGLITLSAPWEWDGPPTGDDPYIWASVANVPADRSMEARFDTAFRLNGLDGDDGAAGDDGANGMGVQLIYAEATTTEPTAPATPTGGTRANTGLLDTLPTGWALTPPTTAGYKWASYVGLPGLRTAAPVYGAPFVYGGVDGTQSFEVYAWWNSTLAGPPTLNPQDTTVDSQGTALTRPASGWGVWQTPATLTGFQSANPYLWVSNVQRNPNTGHTVFGHPYRVTPIDGEDGDDGAQGARGDDGRSFVVLYYGNDNPDSGPTDPTTWRREADGTPDFNNPPSGWSAHVPNNRHIWIIIATVPGDITSPISFRSSIRITGLDGADGAASAAGNSIQVIFIRATSAPDAPTGGTRNTDGSVNELPSGWSSTVPSGDDPLYASAMTIPGDRAAALVYTGAFRLSGTDGPRGAQGIDGYGTIPIYRQLPDGTTADRPTGGSYTGGTLTPPADWSLTEPADVEGQATWYAFAVVAPDGSITYSLPRLPGEDGADGAPGTDGTDGIAGTSLYIIFQRSALMPDAPDEGDGQFEIRNGVRYYEPPQGWSQTVPTGTDILWATFVTVDTDRGQLPVVPDDWARYGGVFTLGEALNITEIRNDLAALTGNDRLPASAIAGLVAGQDPRVDALEHATVDLNAISGRTIEGHETTDDIDIALTEDEDPNELPDARWAKNVLASGRPQSIWIRIPETLDQREGSTTALDFRNYVIQVTTPDESEIIQEIAVSSFDNYAVDTSDTYSYLRQGHAAVPVYTWLTTSHVRIRKYEPTDRHSVYTGITVVPDVGSVPDTERVEGELRRSGDDTLQIFNRQGAWQNVFESIPIDQLDSLTLTAASNWAGPRVLPDRGLGIDIADAGIVAALTHPKRAPAAQGPTLGVLKPDVYRERGSDNRLVPGSYPIVGWTPFVTGIYEFDVSVLLTNGAISAGAQPGSVWLELMVVPITAPSRQPHVLLRGEVTSTSYYEPAALKLTGMGALRTGDRVFLRVQDAFGQVEWVFTSGVMRLRLDTELAGVELRPWNQQFLPEYPEGVTRRYAPNATLPNLTQRTITLYSRGRDRGEDHSARQAHTSLLFAGELGEHTQAHTTQLFSGVLGLPTQASTTGIFSGTVGAPTQAGNNGFFSGTPHNMVLKTEFTEGVDLGYDFSTTPPDLDHRGASGNGWAIRTVIGTVTSGEGYAITVGTIAAGDQTGKGLIEITVDPSVTEPQLGGSSRVQEILEAMFDFPDAQAGLAATTPFNVPAQGSTWQEFIMAGGADGAVTAGYSVTATLKEVLPEDFVDYGTSPDTFNHATDWIGASGNQWRVLLERGDITSATNRYNVSVTTHPGGGQAVILVDNRVAIPRWGDDPKVRNLLNALFAFSETPADNAVLAAPAPNVNTPTEVTLTGGADAGAVSGPTYTATLKRELPANLGGQATSAFTPATDWLGVSGDDWIISFVRSDLAGDTRYGVSLGTLANGAGHATITVDNRIATPTWGTEGSSSATIRDFLNALFDFTRNGEPVDAIPDDTTLNVPAPNAAAINYTFSGGADAEVGLAVPYVATLRRRLPASLVDALPSPFTSDFDSEGASGNRWELIVARFNPIEGADPVSVTLSKQTSGANSQAGQIRIAVANSLAFPTWADIPQTEKDEINGMLTFSGVPLTGIPGNTVLRAPPASSAGDTPEFSVQFVGGVDSSQSNVLSHEKPDPPERTTTGRQAYADVQASNFTTSGKAVRLHMRTAGHSGDAATIPASHFVGSEGNHWALRLIITSATAVPYTGAYFLENGRRVIELGVSISVFNNRGTDDVYASDFFSPGTDDNPQGGRYINQFATIQRFNDPNGPDVYNWELPGFPPLDLRQVGDAVTYDFRGGQTGGDIVYADGGFLNPGWAYWHEEDPRTPPESDTQPYTLWLAQALATQTPDFRWSYGEWSVFSSGLAGHHVQYSASPNGPWDAVERTTGFWRHRDADGTWGPAIQIHDASSGEWILLNELTIADANSNDDSFGTTSTWTNNNGDSITNHGHVYTLARSFNLNDYFSMGFEFEFWQSDVHSDRTHHDFVMNAWAEFPVDIDWETPPPTNLFAGILLPDPDSTIAYIMRRQGTTSTVGHAGDPPLFMAVRPGTDSGYWFGGRRPSSRELWYNGTLYRGGMFNLASNSFTDRKFVDRLAFFNRANNEPQRVRIWGKLK